MKKLRYILGISLLLPAFAFAPVLAETTTSGTGSGDTTTVKSDDSTDSTEQETIKEPSTDPTEMKNRLEHLKTNLKIKLDDTSKRRIALKCKPAQAAVIGAEKNDKANGTKRNDIYKRISASIKSLIDKLNADNVDTTALAAAKTTLDQKIVAFDADMTAYQQALSDLHSLDCVTDPAAFQAALTTARTDREKLRTDAVDIRTFITTTLKPALKAVRDKLKPTTEDSDTSTTTGGTH